MPFIRHETNNNLLIVAFYNHLVACYYSLKVCKIFETNKVVASSQDFLLEIMIDMSKMKGNQLCCMTHKKLGFVP